MRGGALVIAILFALLSVVLLHTRAATEHSIYPCTNFRMGDELHLTPCCRLCPRQYSHGISVRLLKIAYAAISFLKSYYRCRSRGIPSSALPEGTYF